MAFLQCLDEVELSGVGARDACLGEEVLLDSLGSDATSITFCVHYSKGMLKGCQSILPRGDDTFTAIQFPLSGKELLLQLDGHNI
jgi:hypothetical protein